MTTDRNVHERPVAAGRRDIKPRDAGIPGGSTKNFPRTVGIILLIILFGCARPVPLFQCTDENFKLRGTTIAVLAGLDDELNTLFAAYVSDSLKKQSRFRVVSQQEIARSLTLYPVDIRGPYTSAYFFIEDDYANTDIVKLKEMNRRIGADYIYVIWVPTTYWSSNKKLFNVLEIAQLFEFPSGREVGRSAVRTPIKVERDVQNSIENRLKIEAEEMAGEIAEKTGTAKKSTRNPP